MSKETVSIVIPAYNASNYLAKAIDSALAQTYDNIEIIVVNDGSKDDGATRAVALSYGDKIRYIEKQNGGSSSALNEGIKNMKGEWFSWLSHDDLYYPEKIEKQLEYLSSLNLSGEEKHKHFFFCSCDLINGEGAYIKKISKAEGEAMAQKVASLEGNEYLIAEPTKYNFYGCGCLIHKKVFEEIGLFDENLRLLNDIDMWYRIYSAGYILHFLPKSLVMGRIHSKQISRSIGFSYHNSEQDMFWQRSLDYLKQNCKDNFEVFYLYGKNAFSKTRNENGEEAFKIALSIKSDMKTKLTFEKNILKLKAFIRSKMKAVYMKLFMK